MYIVISTSCDGIYIRKWNKDELLKAMTEEDSGIDAEKILDEIPQDADPMYWGNSMLIIKGEIVTPKPEKIVKSYSMK